MGRNRRRRAHNKENKDRKLVIEDKKKADINEDNEEVDVNSKLNGIEDEGKPLLNNSKTILDKIKTLSTTATAKDSQDQTSEASISPEPCLNDPSQVSGSKPQSQHRDYYLHYLCQVCKIIPEMNQKVNCAKCKLVTYCSIEHKREHWPAHADVCQILAELFKSRNFKNSTPDDFRKIRVDIIEKSEKAIERPLEKFEKEMVLYFNRCFKCYEQADGLLKSCKDCKHVSFCKDHPLNEDHGKHCLSLSVYRDIVLHIIGDELVSIYFPDTFSQKFKEIDMKTLCSKETDSELESAFLSELATSPLSVLQALKIAFGNYEKVPKKLCVHVIGAENDFELSAIEKWEIFLAHYLQCSEILIVFIGPELYHQVPNQSLSCEECDVWGKQIIAKFHPHTLYHDYVQGTNYVKPDLVCSFNPGFYRSTGFNKEDTWEETIVQILHQNVPVLVTAYTEIEIIKDVERIQQTSKLKLLQPPSINLFSSLKPFLSFVNDEVSPVIFKNHYYTVFKKK